jgi:SWI/SNF-related matrix-associated actin-dependent regulator of chromatin subfamily A-like protein 1
MSSEIILPKGLECRPYQIDGVLGIFQRNCTLLADEQGLGKTIQACGAINMLSAFDEMNILIVCPTSLKFVWRDEIEKWVVPERTLNLYYGKTTTTLDFPEQPANVPPGTCAKLTFHIVGYNLAARKDIRLKLRKQKFDMVIYDEAHTLRNPKAKQTQVCLGFNNTIPYIREAKYFLCLTGTPIANRPKDIFPIISRLAPKVFGDDFHEFGVEFCGGYEGKWGWDYSGKSNLKKLHSLLINSVMIRRKKKDVLQDLPDKTVIPVLIDPTDRETMRDLGIDPAGVKVLKEYLEAEKIALDAMKLDKYGPEAIQKVSKVQSSTRTKNGVSNVEFGAILDDVDKLELALECIAKKRKEVGDIKASIAADFVQNLLDGGEEKVVVFAHHTSVIDIIRERLKAYGVVKLVGSSTSAQREAAVKAFQTDESIRVIILNIIAGGTGITLTRSSRVVFAELDWTPSNIDQCIDRCHRFGQKFGVVAQLLVLKESLEAHIAKMIEDKSRGISIAIDGA